MRGEAGEIDVGADAVAVGAGRVVERHAVGGRLWAQGDAARHAVLLRSGRFRLVAASAYGAYTVAEFPAPCLVGLSELLSGQGRFASLEAVQEGESVRIGENEAKVLLTGRTPASAAFRRLLILSSTQVIRLVNESLGGFFSPPRTAGPPGDPNLSGAYPVMVEGQPATAERVRELFDRLGIGVPLLLRFGLVERTYPEGARLTRTGEEATEAFLTYAGQVRVSVKIPGVGEEALSILGPGEMVGEMGLVDGSVRSAYAIAHAGPATVFVMTQPVFRSLLAGDVDGSPPLVARIASSLARRVEETAARAVAFFVLSGGNGAASPPGSLDLGDEADDLLSGPR